QSTFAKDFVDGNIGKDLSNFSTGSKDIQNISGGGLDQNGAWQCAGSNNIGDKVNLINAYAVLFNTNPGDPTGHNIVYAGLERAAIEGSADAGFWLLKDNTVNCPSVFGANTNFVGNHKDGDILFVAEYTSGGKVGSVRIFNWVKADAAHGGDGGGCITNLNVKSPTNPNPITQVTSQAQCNEQPIATGPVDGKPQAAGDTACATVNGDPTVTKQPFPNFPVTPPWHAEYKSGSTAMDTPQFLEMGLDMTAFKLDIGCFSKFLPDTRSSAP